MALEGSSVGVLGSGLQGRAWTGRGPEGRSRVIAEEEEKKEEERAPKARGGGAREQR